MNALTRAGFVERRGKGSHRIYRHPGGTIIVLSGHPGDDARPYQLRQVRIAIEQVRDEKD